MDSNSEQQDYNITGSVSFADQKLSQLNLAQYTIKATYAGFEENRINLNSDGHYSLPVKPAAFSLTIFEGTSIICAFMFSLEKSLFGSLALAENIDFGEVTCTDGQAIVPSQRLSDKVDINFLNQLKNGHLDDEIKAKLLDESGHSVIMISGSEWPNNSSRPNQLQPLACDEPGCNSIEDQEEFGLADPQFCKNAGYNISEPFSMNYENSQHHSEYHEGPTLFITPQDDTTFTVVSRFKDPYGSTEDRIFPDLTFTASGKELSLTGERLLPVSHIKGEVAAKILTKTLNSMALMKAARSPIPPIEPYCDPLQLANNIAQHLEHPGFTDKSILEDEFSQLSKPNNTSHIAAPACSTLSEKDLDFVQIKDFCYQEDGKTLKTQTSIAAISICQAANQGAMINYTDMHPLDSDGKELFECVREWNDTNGWHQAPVINISSEVSCYATDNHDNHQEWYKWKKISRKMSLDCAELHDLGIHLNICQWSFPPGVAPNFSWTDQNIIPEPPLWSEQRYLVLEGDSVASEAAAHSGNHGLSQIQSTLDTINHCASMFNQGNEEIQHLRTKTNTILTALNFIKSERESDGTHKYIQDEVKKFHQRYEFSFTLNEIKALEKILVQTTSALDSWANSLASIKKTYSTIRAAAVRVTDDRARRCIPDEIASHSRFEPIYTEFNRAYHGIKQDQKHRGIAEWQDNVFRHFQCMSMDKNIRVIKNFGLSAPTQGQKNPNTVSESLNGQRPENEPLRCAIPPGASTYIPFDGLLDLTSVGDGCHNIKQKVALIGKEAMLDHIRNGVHISSGDLIAKVLMMTHLTKEDCVITAQLPKLDENQCFVYTNNQDISWTDLSHTEHRRATASEFSLSFKTIQVELEEIASQDIMELLLLPNSSLNQE